ncbi:MAG: hypothetical protein K2M04_02575 [Muribaculaceae bacterium]|nr:hypothetical protein [Muribaculaceae bacterium]
MKKIIAFLMVLGLIIPQVGYAADKNKTLQKALKKEYKAKKKELEKGGWQLFGSSRTIDVALLKHYDKLEALDDNGYEVVGTADNFKSKNIGHQMAINNATTVYGQQAGSTLKGRVVSDMGANGTDNAAEFDHFYAAYERLVEKEIKNEMTESFTIIRQLPDGNYEMQSFFIVDENSAVKARMRALENAAKETELAQDFANKISDFVRGGLDRE